jgi:RNA polymerase sigma factor (sigma-70 family)
VTLPPFQAVLDEHGPAVLRLLRRLVGPTDADDDWQETFIAALRAYPRLRPDSDVRAWLLTIAHHKAIDRFRARGRQPVPRDVAEAVVATPELDSDPYGEAQLWAWVKSLPDKQRLAVGYRYGADMAYEDIAVRLECTPAAARRSVFEGLRTLRRQLEPEEART